MCLRRKTMQFTDEYSEKTDNLKSLIDNADAIVIGAGAGLSTAAGFTYSGRRFYENFHDFETKYNFHDMYSGGFYPYDTLEEGVLVEIHFYKSLLRSAETRL